MAACLRSGVGRASGADLELHVFRSRGTWQIFRIDRTGHQPSAKIGALLDVVLVPPPKTTVLGESISYCAGAAPPNRNGFVYGGPRGDVLFRTENESQFVGSHVPGAILGVHCFELGGRLFVASASDDRSVGVWEQRPSLTDDAGVWEQRAKLVGHADKVWCVDVLVSWSTSTSETPALDAAPVFPASTVVEKAPLLASGSVDETVRLWSLGEDNFGECLRIISLSAPVRSVAFLPSGDEGVFSLLVGGDDGAWFVPGGVAVNANPNELLSSENLGDLSAGDCVRSIVPCSNLRPSSGGGESGQKQVYEIVTSLGSVLQTERREGTSNLVLAERDWFDGRGGIVAAAALASEGSEFLQNRPKITIQIPMVEYSLERGVGGGRSPQKIGVVFAGTAGGCLLIRVRDPGGRTEGIWTHVTVFEDGRHITGLWAEGEYVVVATGNEVAVGRVGRTQSGRGNQHDTDACFLTSLAESIRSSLQRYKMKIKCCCVVDFPCCPARTSSTSQLASEGGASPSQHPSELCPRDSHHDPTALAKLALPAEPPRAPADHQSSSARSGILPKLLVFGDDTGRLRVFSHCSLLGLTLVCEHPKAHTSRVLNLAPDLSSTLKTCNPNIDRSRFLSMGADSSVSKWAVVPSSTGGTGTTGTTPQHFCLRRTFSYKSAAISQIHYWSEQILAGFTAGDFVAVTSVGSEHGVGRELCRIPCGGAKRPFHITDDCFVVVAGNFKTCQTVELWRIPKNVGPRSLVTVPEGREILAVAGVVPAVVEQEERMVFFTGGEANLLVEHSLGGEFCSKMFHRQRDAVKALCCTGELLYAATARGELKIFSLRGGGGVGGLGQRQLLHTLSFGDEDEEVRVMAVDAYPERRNLSCQGGVVEWFCATTADGRLRLGAAFFDQRNEDRRSCSTTGTTTGGGSSSSSSSPSAGVVDHFTAISLGQIELPGTGIGRSVCVRPACSEQAAGFVSIAVGGTDGILHHFSLNLLAAAQEPNLPKDTTDEDAPDGGDMSIVLGSSTSALLPGAVNGVCWLDGGDDRAFRHHHRFLVAGGDDGRLHVLSAPVAGEGKTPLRILGRSDSPHCAKIQKVVCLGRTDGAWRVAEVSWDRTVSVYEVREADLREEKSGESRSSTSSSEHTAPEVLRLVQRHATGVTEPQDLAVLGGADSQRVVVVGRGIEVIEVGSLRE